ncbi:hypothetical protein MAIT1_03029 [Magnetofaba australis IT-1]|uniref:Uncharacterized protein n=1 Tax=Magnetofaba australis IT-1 TaxID=1434232 RepID=A0A1Y2K5G3_9PROT|nr:hypothetical protein MAIT1_03029 [Magnetofaba australis IT-1]
MVSCAALAANVSFGGLPSPSGKAPARISDVPLAQHSLLQQAALAAAAWNEANAAISARASAPPRSGAAELREITWEATDQRARIILHWTQAPDAPVRQGQRFVAVPMDIFPDPGAMQRLVNTLPEWLADASQEANHLVFRVADDLTITHHHQAAQTWITIRPIDKQAQQRRARLPMALATAHQPRWGSLGTPPSRALMLAAAGSLQGLVEQTPEPMPPALDEITKEAKLLAELPDPHTLPLLSPAELAGKALSLRAGDETKRARIVLEWPTAVEASHQVKNNELLLTFDQPLSDAGLEKLPQVLANWIGDVRFGFNTLLLRPLRPNTRFAVLYQPTRVTIVMSVEKEVLAEQENRDIRARRLDYLESRLDVVTDGTKDGRGKLRMLLDESPRNTEFLGNMANWEQQLSRWRRALNYYDRGLRESPGEANLIIAQALLRQQYEPSLDLGRTWRNTNLGDEAWITDTATFSAPMSNRLSFELTAQQANFTAHTYAVGGFTFADIDITRRQGGASMRLDYDDADHSEMGVMFGDSNELGLRAAHQWRWEKNDLTLDLRYREPYWGYIAAAAGNVARNRVRGVWQGDMDWAINGLTGNAAVEYDTYVFTKGSGNVGEVFPQTGDFAHTVGYQFSLLHNIPEYNFTLSYSVDGEFTRDVDNAPNFDLPTFFVNLTDRETHAVNVSWSDLLTDYLDHRVVLGYSYDRVTKGQGPGALLGLTYSPFEDFEVDLSVQYAQAQQVGEDATTTTTALRATWIF